MSCPEAGSWKRHNGGLCSPIDAIATAAGFDVVPEVPVQGKQRPADLLVRKWRHGCDAALDATVVHSLNPSHSWDVSLMAVDKAEAGKHDKYDAICAAAGLQFIPIGADTFGAYGLEAQQFLSQLFQRYAKRSTHDDEVSFAGKLQMEC